MTTKLPLSLGLLPVPIFRPSIPTSLIGITLSRVASRLRLCPLNRAKLLKAQSFLTLAFGVRDCNQNGKDFDAKYYQLAALNGFAFPTNHVYHHLVIRPTIQNTTLDTKDITIEIEYLFYPRGPILQKADDEVIPPSNP